MKKFAIFLLAMLLFSGCRFGVTPETNSRLEANESSLQQIILDKLREKYDEDCVIYARANDYSGRFYCVRLARDEKIEFFAEINATTKEYLGDSYMSILTRAALGAYIQKTLEAELPEVRFSFINSHGWAITTKFDMNTPFEKLLEDYNSGGEATNIFFEYIHAFVPNDGKTDYSAVIEKLRANFGPNGGNVYLYAVPNEDYKNLPPDAEAVDDGLMDYYCGVLFPRANAPFDFSDTPSPTPEGWKRYPDYIR